MCPVNCLTDKRRRHSVRLWRNDGSSRIIIPPSFFNIRTPRSVFDKCKNSYFTEKGEFLHSIINEVYKCDLLELDHGVQLVVCITTELAAAAAKAMYVVRAEAGTTKTFTKRW